MSTPWLAALMVISVAAVAALGIWDEGRESDTALADFGKEQATLAGVAASGLAMQLGAVRREALAAADEAAHGQALTPTLANEYVALRVRAATDPPLSAEAVGQAFPLSVPVPDGRRVDLLVPMSRLLPGERYFARSRTLAFLLPPGADRLYAPDGRTVAMEPILRAHADDQSWVSLSKSEASALGLPARLAMAGMAAIDVSPLGRWTMVVVASAGSERDREFHGRLRLLLGVLLVSGLVVAFGGVALRTQRKELELRQALALSDLQREREEQLERESRAATMLTLAAGVAHEVSTPLGVILGRAEQLAARTPEDDTRAQRSIQVILEQAARIGDVVRGFLRLARGDAPVLDRVSPSVIARAAARLVEHRFAKAGVALGVEVPEHLPQVRGDARLLEQALVNLLLNACDACRRGGHVEVCVATDGASVTFTVTDDGAGIRPEHAARVVEPFFSTKPSDQGTGLGLSIAKEIVAIHRGTLALEPSAPQGTRATIRVPTEQDGA